MENTPADSIMMTDDEATALHATSANGHITENTCLDSGNYGSTAVTEDLEFSATKL